MEYSVFLVFMIGSVVVYGLLFWMWAEKWVSLPLILGVVSAKFLITVGWTYSMKVRELLKRSRKPPKDESQ